MDRVELLKRFIRHDPISDRYDNDLSQAQSVSTSIQNDLEIRKVVNQLHIKNYHWVRSTPLKN
jgi:hypothetical protein